MKTSVRILFLVLVLAACKTNIPDTPAASDKIKVVFDNYWKEFVELNPLTGTLNGIHDYNDQLEISISETYLEKLLELTNRYRLLLKDINYNSLSEDDKLSYDILDYQLGKQLQSIELGITPRGHRLRPIDQFVWSFHSQFAVYGSGAGLVPFKTVKDYDNFLQRISIFQQWVDVAIDNMKIGVTKANTTPKICMEKVLPQLATIAEGSEEENLFYKPILNMPDSFSRADQERLKAAYSKAIVEIIQPSYKKLHDYIAADYIPKARTTTGLIDNHNGKTEYAYWVEFYTTTTLSPDSIYELGLSEVARIRKEMDSLKMATGFRGDLKAFLAFVQKDPKFFPFKTEEEVLARYRSFEPRMQPQLDRLFGLVPKAAFEVRATEKFRQAGANAQYMAPARDGSKPGIFYETIPDPLQYNYLEMETLFLHEAIPGHHYQVALQHEMELPEFRKASFFAAYSEGWALYAESLGNELGMFQDPYQYLGRLSADMERSIRLVVDVGMHHKGWPREKAIQYILDNQPMTPAEAVQRIERYMVIGGQALSYKIGEKKIRSLRLKAKQKLGDHFNIRDFHDEVIRDGAMPLDLLEAKVDRWIDRQIKQ